MHRLDLKKEFVNKKLQVCVVLSLSGNGKGYIQTCIYLC